MIPAAEPEFIFAAASEAERIAVVAYLRRESKRLAAGHHTSLMIAGALRAYARRVERGEHHEAQAEAEGAAAADACGREARL